jgi:hypothetical protein
VKKFAFALCIAAFMAISSSVPQSAACVSTGFNGLTALMVNPAGTVSGPVNASGCDIAIYYNSGEGKVENAQVSGARWYGIAVNGDNANVSVDVLNSQVSNIGDVPLNGNQRGVAVYYRAFFTNGSATGRISGNSISLYQKGGIVVNGQGSDVQVLDNEVNGLGAVAFIAQNGIQVGYGANASVMRNVVRGNSYTGNFWTSGGILVVGGAGYGTCPDGNSCPYTVGTRIMQNTVDDSDVGVYLSNYAADLSAPASATNIKVVNNIIRNEVLLNPNYQAGISDVGNNDKMITNTIVGYASNIGYTVKIDADPSFTNRAKVHAEK